MKKILYICDRCKREIEKNPVKLIAKEVDRESEDYLYGDPYPELKLLDLCKNCGDSIVGLIKRHCARGVPATVNQDFEKAVEEAVQDFLEKDPPPTEKSKARKIDQGKVMALHKAGWTAAKIADEMQCSVQAVYNILKKGEKDVREDTESHGISAADAGGRRDGQ